jgi:predicted ester cyclase
MSTEEQLKDAYRRIIDAISRGDAGGLDELMAPDVVDHNPIPNGEPGREGFKQWMAAARTVFPDMRGTVEDVIADGDQVAARMRWHGTHRGESWAADRRASAFRSPRFIWCVSHKTARSSGGVRRTCWGRCSN